MKISGKKIALAALVSALAIGAFAAPAEAYYGHGGRSYWRGGYWHPYAVGYYGPAYYPPPVVVTAPPPAYYGPAYAPAYYGPAAPVGVSLGVHIR